MNLRFTGNLFDGESLAAPAVSLEVGDHRLRSETAGITLDVPVAEVRTSDRLASLPRFLYLPDGRTIATPDNDSIDALLAGQRRGRVVAAVHWLEARARVAAAATLLLVAGVAATVWWGLPVFARRTAMAVPASIEAQAGKTALLTIDRLLAPTQLQPAEMMRVEHQLDRLISAGGLDSRPQLVFRSMGGQFPNAFALPGGHIVVSDELVRLATADEEVAAVLAHEIGHWQHRHGLQSMLRSSAALLVVSTVTGDLSTLTTFAGTIPFVLLQRGYAREFEEEADTYAVDLLRKARIDAAYFAVILKKLEAARPPQGQDFTYLSTHPATPDRIRRIDPTGAAARLVQAGPAGVEPVKFTSSQNKQEPIILGAHDTPPRVLQQAAPRYPSIMAANSLEGSVTLEFVIDEKGDVHSPRIVRSSYKEFEAEAVAAVLQWKFTPARHKGRTVSTRVLQTLEFNLKDQPPKAEDAGASPPAVSGLPGPPEAVPPK